MFTISVLQKRKVSISNKQENRPIPASISITVCPSVSHVNGKTPSLPPVRGRPYTFSGLRPSFSMEVLLSSLPFTGGQEGSSATASAILHSSFFI